MSSLSTIPLPDESSFNFLTYAQRAFAEYGYDFNAWFDACFEFGVVIKDKDKFVLAIPQEGAWHIVWLGTRPGVHVSPMKLVAMVIRHAPYPLPKVSWARALKGRTQLTYFSWDRLMRLGRYTDEPPSPSVSSG